MSNKNTKPKVVQILIERKLRGVIKHDSFFDYVDSSQKKYFAKGFDFAYDHVAKLDLTANRKDRLFRNVLIMSVAHQGGYIDVDWDRFFNQSAIVSYVTADTTIEFLNKYHPEITKMWDDSIKKLSREQNTKDRIKKL